VSGPAINVYNSEKKHKPPLTNRGKSDGSRCRLVERVGENETSCPAADPDATERRGRAVRGIGEKPAANSVTVTGSLTAPIATSLERSGFGPERSVSYDLGAGNRLLGLAGISPRPRSPARPMPTAYLDGQESDVIVVSGSEDFVPCLVDVAGQLFGAMNT
jgi:hypothetical protein